MSTVNIGMENVVGSDPKKVNTQLYSNSILKSLLDEDSTPDPKLQLFNSKDPNLAILHEKAEHRLVIFMKAKGCSNREIAAASGFTEPWISQILRQPWARQRLVDEISKVGRSQINTVLEGAALDSVFTLIDIRDSEKVQPAVRRAACVDLLDRFLGKPKQQVEVTTDSDATSDPKELEREIEANQKEINRLQGVVTE